MKIRRMLTLLSVGAITVMNFSSVVQAQEVPVPDAQKGTSEAEIEFEAATDKPDIINPDGPDNPGDPTNPGTENTGPLTLDFAPAVDFGLEKISSTTQTYSAIMSGYSPFVQVTDRRGSGAGWQLKANFSGFYEVITEEDDTETLTNTRSLPGTKIIFSEGEPITNGTSEDNEPEVKGTISLSENATADMFMEAPENKGMGSWAIVWRSPDGLESPNDKIKLEVPGGTATTGKHKATITWTLSDVPTTPEPSTN